MTENHAAETETVQITLDPSKLLGFPPLATLGEGADLRRVLEDTHNKIGGPGELPTEGASGEVRPGGGKD